MKKNQLALVAVLCCSLMAVPSCNKETREDPVLDPLPIPEDYIAGKDSSVDPGDSFFDYCNGGWLRRQDPHPASNISGPYDGVVAMGQRLEQLKSSVPDIGRFYQLMDNIYSQPEKELAFINAKKAAVRKPSSKEEAFRAIGKMMAEGAPFYYPGFYLVWQDGQFHGVILPPMTSLQADEEGNYNLVPLTAPKTDASLAEK